MCVCMYVYIYVFVFEYSCMYIVFVHRTTYTKCKYYIIVAIGYDTRGYGNVMYSLYAV